MTPSLSPNFPLMYLKRCTHDVNLQLLLTIQLLTYKTSSRVNFHIGGHVCMSISVCHLISYFLSQLSCFHINVSFTRRIHARVHRIQDGYLHTFWLTKTRLPVKFNISHRDFLLTSHWCATTWLTNEPFSECTFWNTKPHLRTLVWLIQKLWCAFTVKIRPYTQLFDLHGRLCV